MVFTNGQLNAIEVVGNFINSSYKLGTNDIITLTGPAGSGKTTVVKEIIKRSTIRSVAVSAPTHQAKTVINRITGYPGETIQALLGLRPNMNMEEFDPTNVLFLPEGQERISKYGLVIIDECSMIGDYIDKLIHKLSKEYKVKILFIGDRYQLPPVEKNKTDFKISPTFTKYPQVELTEIVRQADSNPVNELIYMATQDVINGTDKFLPHVLKLQDTFNDIGEGYLLRKGPDYIKEILTHYRSPEAHSDPYDTKLLAFDNITVSTVNKFLRTQLIKSTELVAPGDLIKGYNTVGEETDTPPYYSSHIRNSEDYIIKDVQIKEVKVLKAYYTVYECTVVGSGQVLTILHPDSKADFEMELVQRHNNGVQFRSWRPFYDFKNKLLVNYEVFNSFNDKVCKKDFDYGYCQTTHKSQGSTYNNVGLYIPSFRTCYHAFTRRSLLYVATSRTSKTLLFYDNK